MPCYFLNVFGEKAGICVINTSSVSVVIHHSPRSHLILFQILWHVQNKTYLIYPNIIKLKSLLFVCLKVVISGIVVILIRIEKYFMCWIVYLLRQVLDYKHLRSIGTKNQWKYGKTGKLIHLCELLLFVYVVNNKIELKNHFVMDSLFVEEDFKQHKHTALRYDQ